MNVTGFGDADANGTYTETGTYNGYPLYVKNEAYSVGYYPTGTPAPIGTGYYHIFKITRLYGANTITNSKYRMAGTNIAAGTWTAMVSWDSGEAQVGTVTL